MTTEKIDQIVAEHENKASSSLWVYINLSFLNISRWRNKLANLKNNVFLMY